MDAESRLQKAEMILAVINDCAPGCLANARCLDIGCSSGIITVALSRSALSVIGIDVDVPALQVAMTHDCENAAVAFAIGSGTAIPFEDESFHVVVCNHVYEHVPSVEDLFAEVYRVLRPGGYCYVACTNKYYILEPHYKLPFLSWLPRSWANAYLRSTGRGVHYEEQLRSLPAIRKLFVRFKVREYTLRILKDPKRFHVPRRSLVRCVSLGPSVLIKALMLLAPNYIWMLEKSTDESTGADSKGTAPL
jgi:ubiquinone/menaquinone biosynthesis C-methylase UbiE